uniref:Uncharacterized protein n=1 Tax=Cannabis sativa TaxID=3483 RepID=A0A803P4Q3_CANSA
MWNVIGVEAPLFVDLEELKLGSNGKPTQDSLRSQVEKLDKLLEERANETQIIKEATPQSPLPKAHSVPTPASIPITSEAQELVYYVILARLESVEKEKIALKQGQTAILKG